MEVLKLIPPFTYSYQCGSTLLTSYIPVYLFSSISQIIVDVFRVMLRLQTKYSDYPRFIQQNFLLPHQSLHPSTIISNIITNLMLLLSFGLSSPVLCVSISLSGVIDVSSYLILLGRVILTHEEMEREREIEIAMKTTKEGVEESKHDEDHKYPEIGKKSMKFTSFLIGCRNEIENNNERDKFRPSS